MSVVTIIRTACLAGANLHVREGRLFIAAGDAPLPLAVRNDIKMHKASIIMALDAHATIPVLRLVTMRRCLPLTPDDLTPAERSEVERLAAELVYDGGLGQFVVDLMHTWNGLTDRERLMAAWCWEAAAVPRATVEAA